MRMLSMQGLDEIESTLAEHATAPERRVAQRALAHELTQMVHGVEAAAAADEAAAVLFGGDPTTASAAALAAVAREVPSSTMSSTGLDDLVGVFVGAGLASSNGDARRTLQQRGFRVNGVQIDENTQLSDIARLHGRYLLLRKGKANHHLIEIS